MLASANKLTLLCSTRNKGESLDNTCAQVQYGLCTGVIGGGVLLKTGWSEQQQPVPWTPGCYLSQCLADACVEGQVSQPLDCDLFLGHVFILLIVTVLLTVITVVTNLLQVNLSHVSHPMRAAEKDNIAICLTMASSLANVSCNAVLC